MLYSRSHIITLTAAESSAVLLINTAA